MYHRQSIALWLYRDTFLLHFGEDFLHLLASTALVDFPQFRDIHHLIPRVLDKRSRAMQTENLDYHQIEDSDKWEIYVKYRQIVSQFLTGQIPRDPPSSGSLVFSAWSRRGQENYVNLAKYLLDFLSESRDA